MMSASLAALAGFVRAHRRLFVLTGAGVSTGSGIPAYRDCEGQWQRAPPVTHQEFVGSPAVRRRYWARSMLGWPVIVGAAPNAAHAALAQLERAGRVSQLVTQNVDGLHQRAGSARLIELHGNLHAVVCMACGARHARTQLQALLETNNPALRAVEASAAPDGDADIESGFQDFNVPACLQCGGMLKPDVVFFGGSIPRPRVAAAMDALEAADALLVAGSSLMVYSGYRFCEAARAAGKPIAAINIGRTRADDLLDLKIEAECAQVLAGLAEDMHADVEGIETRADRRC